MEFIVGNVQHSHSSSVIVPHGAGGASLGEAVLLADSRGSKDSGGYLSGPASSECKQERGALW